MATKKKKEPNRGGRRSFYPTKVEPYFEEIKKWRKEGQTEENIAKLLGIGYRTFNDYKKRYPQLVQVLKVSTNSLVEELEETMFQMALGKRTIIETEKIIQKDRDGRQTTKIREVTKEIPPHPTLLIFSLKNLAPEKWNDYAVVNNITKVELEKLSEDISNIGKNFPDSDEE